ncbi:unnamed protein product [Oppiella nova]|uniref:C2H2-type domain-containing protein n=1 Tax=Oppiella nova TaxID=334625 RepID=A0A7R9M603_9ACAR|nr:unnamed protein product [Oppiella nova]CAG2171403.1 unnamed protein product [Oppiella nova]
MYAIGVNVANSLQQNNKYKCNEENCGKCFNQRTDLNDHKQRVHCDEKPFVCHFNDCHKSFKTKANLRRHVVVGHRQSMCNNTHRTVMLL